MITRGDVAFAVSLLAVLAMVAYVYTRWGSTAGLAVPRQDPGSRIRSRVIAAIDGKPGSGKTTLCGFLGRAVNVVEKDFDFFTQPLVNPGHSTVKTPEGKARLERWRRVKNQNPSGGIKLMIEFVRAEAREYVATVPDDTLIVFCGISRWGDYDLLPPELSGVPRYLLDIGNEETSKRVALRHVGVSIGSIPNCQSLQRVYSAVKKSAYSVSLEHSKDPTGYVMASGDGGELIRAILGGDARVDQAVVDEVVSEYRAQPTADERLRELGVNAFGKGCALKA